MKDTLGDILRELVGEVFVIRVDMNVGTKEHRVEFMKGLNAAEEFFFNSTVIALSGGEFASIKCNQSNICLMMASSCRSEVSVSMWNVML